MYHSSNQNQPCEPVSVKEWIIANIVMMIPVVNVIMMLVWAFSSNTNPSKANYFKAILLLFVIGIALTFILSLLGLLTLPTDTLSVPTQTTGRPA